MKNDCLFAALGKRGNACRFKAGTAPAPCTGPQRCMIALPLLLHPMGVPWHALAVELPVTPLQLTADPIRFIGLGACEPGVQTRQVPAALAGAKEAMLRARDEYVSSLTASSPCQETQSSCAPAKCLLVGLWNVGERLLVRCPWQAGQCLPLESRHCSCPLYRPSTLHDSIAPASSSNGRALACSCY